jgi:hypothetical protein
MNQSAQSFSDEMAELRDQFIIPVQSEPDRKLQMAKELIALGIKVEKGNPPKVLYPAGMRRRGSIDRKALEVYEWLKTQ